MTRENDGTTTITASIANQAQLHGLLACLRDTGAAITELRAIAPRRTAGYDQAVEATRGRWVAFPWVAGIVFVVALLAEVAVGASLGVTQEDSAAKIVRRLHEHRDRLLVTAYIGVVYTAAFTIYLSRLHVVLRDGCVRARTLTTLVLIGGVVFVVLHAVSDIGITGLLGAKLAAYGAQHDPGIPYTLFLTTFALDSVGGVFSSLFLIAAGLLVIRSGVLPRWLAWVAIIGGAAAFLQGFGLGGVISSIGLAFELVGFVLLLVFVLGSSVVLLKRGGAESSGAPSAA
jgi:Domain of unknown function (DUF4386)